MNRRTALLALAACVIVPRRIVYAQTPVVIGWLNSGSRKASGHYLAAFKEGMAALGWKEGAGYTLEERWADARIDRLPALAAEIAAKKPRVIVAAPTASVQAAVKAAPTTAVIQANGADPVASGLVKSIARPGGMITGVTNIATQVNEKYLELLLAAAPTARRVGFLFDSTTLAIDSVRETVRRAVSRFPVEALFADAAGPDELESTLQRLAKDGAQALILMPSNFFQVERERIVRLALAYRWPMVGGHDLYTQAGALLSYGADRAALVRRAAYYVDKVLKGARPGDLPFRAADEIRARHQSQDSQDVGNHNPAVAAYPRRQGDRMKRRESLKGLGGGAFMWSLDAIAQQGGGEPLQGAGCRQDTPHRDPACNRARKQRARRGVRFDPRGQASKRNTSHCARRSPPSE